MKPIFALLLSIILWSCAKERPVQMVELQNPLIPGYFADPSVVEFEGKYYMYATADPWGGDFLSCWVSDDFQNWTFNKLNWPTKSACTSSLSNGNMVWAPSVIRHGDSFYMYISVGSEIWAGKASHPLGPWENILGDKPFIPFDTTLYSHEIDAEAFIDDDGRAYLYWGSGWGWINGRCWVAELNPDMASFATEKKEITPERYFEAPWMIKHNGRYFLTYSEGKTIEDSYEVRYAIGDSPDGAFVQADNSPILTKDENLQVYGPGHHTIVTLKDQHYILYHKHRLPFVSGTAFRQISMNPLNFTADGNRIQTIVPEDMVSIPQMTDTRPIFAIPAQVIASSYPDAVYEPNNVADRHYGTLWQPVEADTLPVLEVMYHQMIQSSDIRIRFEYPWKRYYFLAETSSDGTSWELVKDYSTVGVDGSPVTLSTSLPFKHLRLSFAQHPDAAWPAVWEVEVEK